MTGHSSKKKVEKYKHQMSNEEHHHLEIENSQNQSHPVYQKF